MSWIRPERTSSSSGRAFRYEFVNRKLALLDVILQGEAVLEKLAYHQSPHISAIIASQLVKDIGSFGIHFGAKIKALGVGPPRPADNSSSDLIGKAFPNREWIVMFCISNPSGRMRVIALLSRARWGLMETTSQVRGAGGPAGELFG